MSDVTIVLILLLIPLASGFAGFAFFNQVKRINKYLLPFSGAFLLSIAVVHILPDVFGADEKGLAYFILAGFLIQIVLGTMSGGVEHGHIHPHRKISYTLYISLMIHSLIEGMALLDTDAHGHGHDHSHLAEHLMIGIVVHKAPVALVLASLLHSTTTRAKAIIMLIVFSLATPIGFLIAPFIQASSDIDVQHYLLAIAVGVFLHVSTVILFESEDGHKLDWRKLLSITIGLGLAMLTMLHVH